MSEKILYQEHPRMFRNHPVGFILCVVLVPAFGFGALLLLLWWLHVLGTTLTITDRNTTLRRGLLSKKTNEVRHVDVRNLQVDQGVLQRMFDVGTLSISSAGQSDVEIMVSGVPQPEGAKELIKRYRATAK